MNLDTLKRTFAAYGENNGGRMAAAIAYTSMLSIVPLFIVVIAVAGAALAAANGGHGHRIVEDLLVAKVEQGAGKQAADTVRQIVAAAFNKPRQSTIAQIAGWIAFIAGAAGLFSTLQDALNSIWRVDHKKRSIVEIVKQRAASFAMILCVGALILASVLVNGFLAFARTHLSAWFHLDISPALVGFTGQILAFVIGTVAFALIFKVLPDADTDWGDVWIGAAATALLFVIGQALISWYLAKAGVASAYGAAGSILVLLLWLYYSATVFIIGAEFAHAWSTRGDSSRADVTATSAGSTSPVPSRET